METVIAQSINPLITKSHKMPPQTFRLPTRGIYYTNNEISDDVVDGELLVYPMTTLEEIYIKTPDMLFQGTAVDKVIKKCVPQILEPMKLLAKDVDFLLTCIREVSYGKKLEILHICTLCEDPKERSYIIDIDAFISNTKDYDPSELSAYKSFDIDNFSIIIKYATFEEMLKIGRDLDETTPETVYTTIVDGLLINIESIDGITDKDVIREFIEQCSRHFQQKILHYIEDYNNWGVKLEASFICRDCKKEQKQFISLNPVSFFTEPSNQETKS